MDSNGPRESNSRPTATCWDHADWCTAPGAGWREALDFAGSRYPGIAAKLFAGLPLAGMEPNWTCTYGKRGLLVPGKLFVLYLPEGGDAALLSRAVPRCYRVFEIQLAPFPVGKSGGTTDPASVDR